MADKRLKRPRDPLQLGKLIVDIATGQVEDRVDDGKNPKHVAKGRKGGLIGGKSRAEALSPEQRSAIAKAGATARWENMDNITSWADFIKRFGFYLFDPKNPTFTSAYDGIPGVVLAVAPQKIPGGPDQRQAPIVDVQCTDDLLKAVAAILQSHAEIAEMHFFLSEQQDGQKRQAVAEKANQLRNTGTGTL